MIKKYVAPYNKNHRDYFTILPFERKVISKLENIFSREKGIFVLYGNHGVGKSSLKNCAIENIRGEKPCVIINIPFYNNNKDLLREILIQLPIGIKTEIDRIKKNIEDIILLKPQLFALDVFNQDEEIQVEESQNNYLCNYRFMSSKISNIKRLYIRTKESLTDLPEHISFENNIFNDLLYEIDKLENHIKDYKNYHCKQETIKERIINKIGIKPKKCLELKELEKRILNIEKKVNELDVLNKNILELNEFFKLTMEQLKQFDLEITNITRYINETTSSISADSSIDLEAKLHFLTAKIGLESSDSLNDKFSTSEEVKGIVTDEIKEKQLMRLLKSMSNTFNISIIIDELDKYPMNEVIELINQNKHLFLDCNITTLLITDIYSGIFIEENSDYIHKDQMILVRSLNLIDFIARSRSKGIHFVNDFFEILDQYYSVKMNNRELVVNKKTNGSHSFPKGFVFCSFMNSNFYKNLKSDHKEIFLNFYWELIELLDHVKKISIDEYDEFVNCFLNRNKIKSLQIIFNFNRLKELFEEQNLEIYYHFLGFSDYESDISLHLKYQNKIHDFLTDFASKMNFYSSSTEKYFLEIQDYKFVDGEKTHINNNYLKNEFTKLLQENKWSDEDFVKSLLQIYKSSSEKYIGRKEWRYAKKELYNPNYGIDDAMKVVKRENVIGIILFYPYNNKINAKSYEKPLQNGIIVTGNDFEEIVLFPYVGYVGLHSHKPYRMKGFKGFLTEEGIKKIYEVKEEVNKYDSLPAKWSNCFDGSDEKNKEKILEICSQKMDKWLEELDKLG